MSSFRKPRISANRSRSTSERLRSSHIGTHNGPVPNARRMNASSVGFSSPRKQRRAARGVVKNLRPVTASGESAAAYNKRINTREFTQQVQARRRLQRIGIVAFVAVLIVVVGVTVGINAFFGLMGSKMALEDQSVQEVLAAQQGDDPYYVLVTADLDESDGTADSVDLLSLVRINAQNKQATFVGIPSNTYVSLSDGLGHKIVEARQVGGMKELVSVVSDLTAAPVSHVVATNAQGITKLADLMGGVTLNLSEEVDDPAAGGSYIAAGKQTLQGADLLTFLRASNFTDGVKAQMANQGLVTALFMQYLSKDSFVALASTLDRCAGTFQTDWSGKGLYSALTDLNGFNVENIYTATLPGYRDSVSADASYIVAASSLTALMEQVNAGEKPLPAGTTDTSSVNPAKVKIEVRNGSGIDGGASAIASVLEAAGYQIAETGNAESYVYGETLVIYQQEENKAAAEAVVEALGTGRAIAANGFYAFNTHVLVVLGGDWKPQQ